MKELIKPDSIENRFEDLENYSESSCCGPNLNWGSPYCDKHCTQGSSNNSVVKDEDILF